MLCRFFGESPLASLIILLTSAHLASATHAPLFPSLHTHLSRPGQRPSHVAHLRSLQAVHPPPSAVLAARERAYKAETVQWLKRLGDGLNTKGEELWRTAERIKRSLGGKASEEEKLRMGVALHDALFALVHLVAASNQDSVHSPLVRPIEDFARARPASPSASPVPSGRVAHQKRFVESPLLDPHNTLRATLSLLTRQLTPAVEVLPYLSLVQQESVRSLCEELKDEVELLVDAVNEGSGSRRELQAGEETIVQDWIARSAALLSSVAANASSPVASPPNSSHDYEAQLVAYREDVELEEGAQVASAAA